MASPRRARARSVAAIGCVLLDIAQALQGLGIVETRLRAASRRHANGIPLERLAPDEARPAGIGTVEAPVGTASARRQVVLPARLGANVWRDANEILWT